MNMPFGSFILSNKIVQEVQEHLMEQVPWSCSSGWTKICQTCWTDFVQILCWLFPPTLLILCSKKSSWNIGKTTCFCHIFSLLETRIRIKASLWFCLTQNLDRFLFWKQFWFFEASNEDFRELCWLEAKVQKLLYKG